MYSISVRDFLCLDNPIIIDIRNSYYYNIEHIDGALNIPFYSLLNNYGRYLNKSDTYYLYCDYGEKSKSIVNKLVKFGYKLYSIDGGFLEYKKIMNM